MDLSSGVENLPKVGGVYARRLAKLDIKTVGDLLNHIPFRYLDYTNPKPIKILRLGETAAIKARVVSIKNVFTKFGKKIQIAQVRDASAEITIIWFNQTYLLNNIAVGDLLGIAGRVGWWAKKYAIVAPDYEKLETEDSKQIHTQGLVPVYPETAGVSSKWLRGRIKYVLDILKNELNINDLH